MFDFVKLNNIYYAGSHGMDISTPSDYVKNGNHKHQTRAIDKKVFLVEVCTLLCDQQMLACHRCFNYCIQSLEMAQREVELQPMDAFGFHDLDIVDHLQGNEMVNFLPAQEFLPKIQEVYKQYGVQYNDSFWDGFLIKKSLCIN